MSPLTILIVDDTRLMTQMLTEILIGLGHRVVCAATNGSEAVAAYRAHRPDLVTMDVTMPDMDGIQATKAIMQEFPEAVIVMVTARGENKIVLDALRAGAKGYLLKPFDPANVAEVIQKACKRKA